VKLIAEWRQSWRLWSVRVSALGAILTGLALAAPDFLQNLWNGLPSDARALLPASVTHAVPLILFVLTIVSRLVAQGGGAGGTVLSDQASTSSGRSAAVDQITSELSALVRQKAASSAAEAGALLARLVAAEQAIDGLNARVDVTLAAAADSAVALATRIDTLNSRVADALLDPVAVAAPLSHIMVDPSSGTILGFKTEAADAAPAV